MRIKLTNEQVKRLQENSKRKNVILSEGQFNRLFDVDDTFDVDTAMKQFRGDYKPQSETEHEKTFNSFNESDATPMSFEEFGSKIKGVFKGLHNGDKTKLEKFAGEIKATASEMLSQMKDLGMFNILTKDEIDYLRFSKNNIVDNVKTLYSYYQNKFTREGMVQFGDDIEMIDEYQDPREETPEFNKPTEPKVKTFSVKYYNNEIAILSDAEGNDYLFNYTDIDPKEFLEFSDTEIVGYEEDPDDGTMSPEYGETNINDETIERFVNTYVSTLSQGEGISGYNDGEDIVLIDSQLGDEIVRLYSEDASKIMSILNDVEESTGAASAGAYVGPAFLEEDLDEDKQIIRGLLGKTLLDRDSETKYLVLDIDSIDEKRYKDHIVVFFNVMDVNHGNQTKIGLNIESIMDLLMGKSAAKFGYDQLVMLKESEVPKLNMFSAESGKECKTSDNIANHNAKYGVTQLSEEEEVNEAYGKPKPKQEKNPELGEPKSKKDKQPKPKQEKNPELGKEKKVKKPKPKSEDNPELGKPKSKKDVQPKPKQEKNPEISEEIDEATGAASASAYSTPKMWAKSKKDHRGSQTPMYKGGTFVTESREKAQIYVALKKNGYDLDTDFTFNKRGFIANDIETARNMVDAMAGEYNANIGEELPDGKTPVEFFKVVKPAKQAELQFPMDESKDGKFVELDDCTKLNNNKEAQEGGCSQGAVDNVVKTFESVCKQVAETTKKDIDEVRKTLIENKLHESFDMEDYYNYMWTEMGMGSRTADNLKDFLETREIDGDTFEEVYRIFKINDVDLQNILDILGL